MLGNSKIVAHIATSRPDESRKFYEHSLGLAFLLDDDFAMVFNSHGVLVRVQKVTEHRPLPNTVLGWDVVDIRTSVSDLSGRGVRREFYERLVQDETGIWLAPGGVQVAWMKDPDGNILSLTQYK